VLARNREYLLEHDEKLLGGLGVVPIHAESHDPPSLLSDTLFAFAHRGGAPLRVLFRSYA